jgi:hypothetical protein
MIMKNSSPSRSSREGECALMFACYLAVETLLMNGN